MSEAITPPNDYQMECLVICSMLRRKSALLQGLTDLEVDDFVGLVNRALFRTLNKLFAEELEVTPQNLLEQADEKDRQLLNEEVLNGYFCLMGPGHNFIDGIDDLKILTAYRRLIYASQAAFNAAVNKDIEPVDIICDFIKKVSMITNKNQKSRIEKEVIDNYYQGDSLQEHARWKENLVKKGKQPYEGIPSGYAKLDRMLGYFRRGAVYLIGARTSMGKTTFLLNLMLNMLLMVKDMKIGFFSLEMPAEQIVSKLVCMLAAIDYDKFDDGRMNEEEMQRFCEACEMSKKHLNYISDPHTLTIQQLRVECFKMVHQQGVKIIFIDYLTRLKAVGKHFNKHLEVDELSKSLQSLAKELNVPIIVLSQLNRGAANGERPGLNSFRESGSVEEDADACILLHRPEYYDKKNKPGLLEVIVAKNRIRGKVGVIEYSWRPGGIYQEHIDLEEHMKNLMEEGDNDRFKHFMPNDR